MLELVLQEPERLPALDVLIIDESQDLSRLQWDLVSELCKRSKRAFLAGDDDQAVYTWAGADVKSFLDFEGEITVLDQSYRVPAKVHALAGEIVKRIRKRQPKVWNPRDYDGQVQYYNAFESVDISQGEWLVMASTNYMLNDMHDWIKSQGLLFERQGQRSISETILTAVLGWESLRKGKEIPFQIARTVYKYLGTEFVKKGHKTLKDADPERLYSLATLEKDHGLLTNVIWHEALTKIGEEKRDYIIALLRRGTRITGKIPIKLSTIHGAKGGEADNVLLLMDISTKFAKEFQKNGDNVNRLFYVGITRAKKSLHLVLPKFQDKGFML
jgi:DNA helicase-2/ATP-dependent DNA helicase PcrA